ncbi:MAG: proton-conducting transporter membrane subunit [Candidatus Methylomirabilis sp.]|nr:proton-conducting transporter membrane subunit [Candidatus Methylomirabilis sp.]
MSLYVLIAYVRTEGRPLEAGLKYLILAAASSAFLLFGMALIYAQAGTLAFGGAASWVRAGTDAPSLYLMTGLALMITGIGFKLAVVPFHMWTPDIYEGPCAGHSLCGDSL